MSIQEASSVIYVVDFKMQLMMTLEGASREINHNVLLKLFIQYFMSQHF